MCKTMPIDKDSNNLNVMALNKTVSANLTKESLLFKFYEVWLLSPLVEVYSNKQEFVKSMSEYMAKKKNGDNFMPPFWNPNQCH